MSETTDRDGRYEAVDPTGPTTPARFASTAARSGFDGIVLRHPPQGVGTDDLARIAEQLDVSVARGATVTASDRSRAGSELARRRDDVAVLFARADEPDLRHFLAGQEQLDVLCVPGTTAGEVGHTTVTRARDHGVYVEIDLGPVLRSSGGRRVGVIEGLRRLVGFVDHYDCPAVVTGSPGAHHEFRSWRELCGVADTVGLDREVIDEGTKAWGEILERTARARDDRFIEPGVEVTPDETDDR